MDQAKNRARIVQGQDSTIPPVQMAVRIRPPRSIPKSLVVQPVAPGAIRNLIVDRHYLHRMPAAPRLCFGVTLDGELNGAVVLTSGARRAHGILTAGQPQQVSTLARLWLSDDLPKNAESRIIGIVLRHLRRQTDWKLLISYADPAAGHVGTIYQATGWTYLGLGSPESYIALADGRILHPRTVYNQFGSNSVGHLRRTGIDVYRRTLAPKHRYLYVLDPAWRWRVRESAQPYPQSAAGAERELAR